MKAVQPTKIHHQKIAVRGDGRCFTNYMLGWMANFNGGGEALVCKYANICKDEKDAERRESRKR